MFDARASLNQRAKLLGFSQLCKAPELNPEGLPGLSEKNSIGKHSSPAGSVASELLIGK